jgi:hypothetical protein
MRDAMTLLDRKSTCGSVSATGCSPPVRLAFLTAALTFGLCALSAPASSAPEAPNGIPAEVWQVIVGHVRADLAGGPGRTTAQQGLGEDAKLTASDAGSSDRFGFSSAISGDTVVVGAYANDHGAAYVFVEPAGGWSGSTENAKLTASDEGNFESFGTSVAVSGDIVVVGAFLADGGNVDTGAAYVFEKPPGGWSGSPTESAKLTASDASENDQFGNAVAVSGDTVVVGASVGDSTFGSAYVFVEPVGGWSGSLTEDAKLTASDGEEDDRLGFSVAIAGDTVVAGANRDNDATGAAYVFVEPTGGWSGSLTEDAKLTAFDGEEDDFFGFSVAISNGTIVAGASANSLGSGAAYVFVEPAGGWIGPLFENARLTTSGGSDGDFFGASVSISEGVVAVGAFLNDDAGIDTGAAYVFVEPVGGWSGSLSQDATLTASDAVPNDRFGRSVGISGDTVVVGAERNDGGGGANSGSAYVFDLDFEPGIIFADGFESGDTSEWSSTVE